MNHRGRLIFAAVVSAVVTLPGFGQVLDHPTLYRLERTSTFTRGCFPPCMCPVSQSVPITGTFKLALITVGNVFDFYEVSQLRMKIRINSGEVVEITGSGNYAVSTIADMQHMEVSLVVGSEPPTMYQSDVVSGGGAFPRIALPISINGGFCHDTVIELRARPARRLYVNGEQVHWDVDPTNANATSDVVYGDLRALHQTAGEFDVATWACVDDSNASGSTLFSGAPAVGEGFWFLEREAGDLYEDFDAAQVGSPDAGIDASPGACP